MNRRISDLKGFLLAGNAMATFMNRETGNKYLYRVRRTHKGAIDWERKRSWLVAMKTITGFQNIGVILWNGQYKGKDASQGQKVFDWVWRHQNHLPPQVEVWHIGRCGQCGRKLTDPESVERGIGPVCDGRRIG